MLAIERLGGTVFGDGFVERVPPMVAALFHRNVAAGTPVNNDVADGGAIGESFVDGVFEANLLAPAPGAIGRDDDAGFEILNAGLERFGRETAENDGVSNA